MNKKILLVEDNPQDEALTLRALRRTAIGDNVDVVRDGAEALDYLLRRGAHAGLGDDALPALVLLDIKLPKLSGLDVLRALRDDPRMHAVPVVMLTSSDEERDIACAYLNGASSYVKKPVLAAEFTDTVGHLAGYWLGINRLPQSLRGGLPPSDSCGAS